MFLSPTGKCLFLSGLIPEQLKGNVGHKMLEYGIGSTNIVERTTRGSADLSKYVNLNEVCAERSAFDFSQ